MSSHQVIAEITTRQPNDMAKQTTINEMAPGQFKLHATFYNPTSQPIRYDELSIDVTIPDSFTYAMIPAVNYNGNTWGQGLEPKGFAWQDTPWVVAAHRTAIPGATFSEDSFRSWALFADYEPQNIENTACSIEKYTDHRVHRLISPNREGPLVYNQRDVLSAPHPVSEQTLAPGDSMHLVSWLITEEVQKNTGPSWRKFMDVAWDLIKAKPLSEEPADTLWSRGITYAVKSLWAEEGSYRGFSIGLIWQDSQWVQRPGWKYEIGWCGQNASLANSLLHDYQLHGNAESLSKALACLDTWSKSTAFPNGLMRTHYDYQLGLTTSQERLDACNLGTAALNFFEAAELTRQVGHAREHLRQMALGICYFILKDQEVSGRYGKAWAISGEALDREGTIGAFLIPPMLQAFVETTDSSYLQSGRQAHRYYMQEFRRSGSTSAGALDTYCIDKESAISLLRSGLRLYQLTNDSVYLQDAVAISYYLSTWLWHVDYPYADTSEFSQYGWSTLGATAVSVQHHHLDPYALLWVPEWFLLSELTGDGQWKEKAQAIWFNGSQLVADGQQTIHGRVRPVGAQNEAFFQTEWSRSPGTFNDWLVAWPTAFRLETLRKLTDWPALTQTGSEF